MNNKNDRNKMGSYYCNYYYDKIGDDGSMRVGIIMV